MSRELANIRAQLPQDYVGFLVTPSILILTHCQTRLKSSQMPWEKGRTPQSTAPDGKGRSLRAVVLLFAWEGRCTRWALLLFASVAFGMRISPSPFPHFF